MDARGISNRLGALALGLSDEMQTAVRYKTGLSAAACAAMANLGFYPGATIGAVARVLGVTHSVAVRIVDELVRKGLVARARGKDRRQVKLKLTREGTKARSTIIAARNAVLENALAALNTDDRQHLDAIVSCMLTKITVSRERADHICRLCDEFVCTPDICPVEREAVRRSEEVGEK